MPAAVIEFPSRASAHARGDHRASWSLLELARPGSGVVPLGILLVDDETDELRLRLRGIDEIPGRDEEDLEEQEIDLLDFLPADLLAKSREAGGRALLAGLEDSLSGFLRIGERTRVRYAGDPQAAADGLYDRHVDSEVRPFVTHLPLYRLEAAATKFGEGFGGDDLAEAESWVRVAERRRADDRLFVARVVGRSMEPTIPDGSLCVFRAGVTGSRQGRRLLIEKFGETDFSSRYTVKRYTSVKKIGEDGDWEHETIRLEPLNGEFDAFELGPEEFRVVAEFVEVLGF